MKKHNRLAGFVSNYYEHIISLLITGIVFFVTRFYVEPIFDLHIEIGYHLLFDATFCSLLLMFLKRRESQQKSIEELNQSTQALQNLIDLKTDAAMLSQKITKNYYEIISHPYNSLITEYTKQIQNSQEQRSLINLVEKISELRKELILKKNEFWRIVTERMAFSHYRSMLSNDYILSLETYCKLLIDSLKIGQEYGTRNNKTLVVISFTSVTPADWFSEREVIGKSLRDYASQMKATIRAMRINCHIFRRLVVCKSEELSSQESEQKKSSMMGFSVLSKIKLDWAKCDPKEKGIYLSDYHSHDSLAEILSFKLPDLKFYNNCNEFVFVGYKDDVAPESKNIEQTFKDISGVTWDWCFCLGYTENNLNVSASFINLSNPIEPKKNIIDIPNTLGLADKESGMHRNKLEVSFNDFPEFVLNNNAEFASVIQFNNLITLAEKWDIAAEIFHSDDESHMMEQFLKDEIPAKSKVLDAACGTGHNSFILQSMGDMDYTLTASDNDEDNLKIFNRRLVEAGIALDHKRADWNNLVRDLGGEKFDAITCLGSSIPYYKSWKEDGNGYEFTREGVTHVLEEFKNSLKMNGKLLIGLSRYINKGLTEINLKFKRKNIEKSVVGAQDSEYDMSWYFKYDWSEKRKRTWDCHIKNDFGDDYSFRLVSHLFDIDELVSFCEEVFGKGNVERRDLHSTSYDMFVICKKIATDDPANS